MLTNVLEGLTMFAYKRGMFLRAKRECREENVREQERK
jgi:hypothetical protein